MVFAKHLSTLILSILCIHAMQSDCRAEFIIPSRGALLEVTPKVAAAEQPNISSWLSYYKVSDGVIHLGHLESWVPPVVDSILVNTYGASVTSSGMSHAKSKTKLLVYAGLYFCRDTFDKTVYLSWLDAAGEFELKKGEVGYGDARTDQSFEHIAGLFELLNRYSKLYATSGSTNPYSSWACFQNALDGYNSIAPDVPDGRNVGAVLPSKTSTRTPTTK